MVSGRVAVGGVITVSVRPAPSSSSASTAATPGLVVSETVRVLARVGRVTVGGIVVDVLAGMFVLKSLFLPRGPVLVIVHCT